MKRKLNQHRVREIEKYFFAQGKVYLDKRLEDLEEIKMDLIIGDQAHLEKIERIGHNLKGSAGLYGFQKLGEIGNKLEMTVQKKDLKTLTNIIDEFQAFIIEAKTQKAQGAK